MLSNTPLSRPLHVDATQPWASSHVICLHVTVFVFFCAHSFAHAVYRERRWLKTLRLSGDDTWPCWTSGQRSSVVGGLQHPAFKGQRLDLFLRAQLASSDNQCRNPYSVNGLVWKTYTRTLKGLEQEVISEFPHSLTCKSMKAKHADSHFSEDQQVSSCISVSIHLHPHAGQSSGILIGMDFSLALICSGDSRWHTVVCLRACHEYHMTLLMFCLGTPSADCGPVKI